MSNKPHKEIPAVTVPIHELRETIAEIYSPDHELTFRCDGCCWIRHAFGDIEENFDNETALYIWHFEQQEKLEEERAENARINAKSAGVDFMNQRF